ncbi:hypothetical protein [Henriciella mobilis]|uniref:hypothetical protein n=1 Tax=Henriciella mobilis TaxID=2305467 RepID=UPI0011C39C8D|nr:hypothetical protein [Henriciella mobilis]
MTDDRLHALIAAYGADPAFWPEDERAAAEAHLAADAGRFAAALEEARALDLAFAEADIPDAPSGLAARILAEAPQAARPGASWAGRLGDILFPNGLRWPAGATAAALVMGLTAGVFTAPATADDGYQTASEDLVYGALGYGGFDAYVEEVSG